jgi:Uncharacterized conserved protein (DUF2285)
MQKPPLDPDVADAAPSDSALTVYDEEHNITYLRLLDADAQDADWRDVARIVLRLDPKRDSDRARRTFESHLSRAKWMTEHGYRHLLRGGASALLQVTRVSRGLRVPIDMKNAHDAR